jgi:hypothetical protein
MKGLEREKPAEGTGGQIERFNWESENSRLIPPFH